MDSLKEGRREREKKRLGEWGEASIWGWEIFQMPQSFIRICSSSKEGGKIKEEATAGR